MTEKVYKSISTAKDRHPDSFENWLENILIFVKTDEISPSAFVKSFDGWHQIFSSLDGYEQFKGYGSEILKYALKKYIYFYHKDCLIPAEMTNMFQIGLDYQLMVDFFNLDYYDIEDTRKVFLGFVEGLHRSCEALDIDTTDMLIRFYRVFFSNYDYEERLKYGPVETRFYTLHRRMTGIMITNNPNKSINVSEAFYEKLDPDTDKKVRELMSNGEKPRKEDYTEALKILKDCESKYTKKDIKVLWENDAYALVKGDKGLYNYLANKNTGLVLKSFELTMAIPQMISESMKLLR